MKKSSKHLVDPELVEYLDLATELPLSNESLPALREGLNNQLLGAMRDSLKGTYSEHYATNPLDNYEVRVLVIEPEDRSKKHPLYFEIHGGGMVIGSADMMLPSNLELSKTVDCVVVSVDYRLAPETPHPGPIEDCYSALKWAYDNAEQFNIDTSKIMIGGGSAGGGLAAALAILVRDRNEVPIIYQDLLFPMLDDRTCVREDHPYAGEFIWTKEKNHFGWSALLGHEPGRDDVSPYAVPARVEDMTGLAPALITIGALDLFIDESLEYAQRLIRAGVPTELHVYPGLYHGAQVPNARVNEQMQKDRYAALKRAFYG